MDRRFIGRVTGFYCIGKACVTGPYSSFLTAGLVTMMARDTARTDLSRDKALGLTCLARRKRLVCHAAPNDQVCREPPQAHGNRCLNVPPEPPVVTPVGRVRRGLSRNLGRRQRPVVFIALYARRPDEATSSACIHGEKHTVLSRPSLS